MDMALALYLPNYFGWFFLILVIVIESL